MATVGATAVGIVCKNGVVLASEKRVAYGYTIISKVGKKVFKITDHLGMACAGLISDMQVIARSLAAEASLYTLDHKRPMPVRSLAKLLSVILYGKKLIPYLTETIIAGVDSSGPHLFVLDPLGSLIEDKYAAVGSGSTLAISIIESNYSPDMDVADGEKLAVEAIKAAIKRDAISGDGIDVLVITAEGSKEKFIPIES
ncbi:MAG: proteasome endopeptidase complex, archaeal, beta subunit [Candidatus Methanomethylicota archaeon]|uniref:Proteasome subunit beta n=1 Tax=Thermoproteota archaeon TaxID=2056631 RepID=A0A497F8I3_9CREN|nr:MAG: proteasome endopeptidase complex, archaeal, beta subunit [Candidatus Verstraetearchaeota archaeon]RLE55923.1 MAG: proteasome endopeptidase complex, archaeal, beta subunit [Candidatus Verstraetearchaeota archaeon]